ncbi:MAG TPA: biotin/lipoyl-containing protein, partial [Lysobacter sp.]|nr:biotin/lipoyl-containing protein [Lysobacter sp.]
LIAKLVTWGRDRDESIARMRRALAEFRIEGLPTTIPFHQQVLDHPAFIAGDATTAFLTEHPDVLPKPSDISASAAQPSANSQTYVVEVNGRRFDVRIQGEAPPARRGTANKRERPAAARKVTASTNHDDGGSDIRSPLQGTVLRVGVEPGASVSAGDLICVVEAMKMENEITAPRDGAIASVNVRPGSTVSVGAVVASFA